MHFLENYLDFWHNEAIFAYKMQKEYKFVSLIHKEKKSDECFPSGLPFILLPSSSFFAFVKIWVNCVLFIFW